MDSLRFTTMTDLLVRLAEQLYDAEHRLTDLLVIVAKNVETVDGAHAISAYLQQTRVAIPRLRQVFSELDAPPRRSRCEPVEGAVAYGKRVLDASGNQLVRETALLAVVQGIQNYEIALYRTLYYLARQLSLQRAALLLQESLEAEANSDLRLTAVIRQSKRSLQRQT